MQKNTAGQKIGVQMVNASDGSAFTGAVTVSVTGDAGTQATGSVGAGACTHEGNGYHTYAPAQAETNYTLIAFTFTGTGAVPATVQVFTWGFDTTAAQVPANVTQYSGTNVGAPDTAGYPKVTIKDGTGTGEIDTASGKVSIVTADMTSIADTILQRDSVNWEAGAAKKSLGAAVMAAIHKIEDDGLGNLIIYRSDGTTEHYRRAITVDATLQPIDTLAGAS